MFRSCAPAEARNTEDVPMISSAENIFRMSVSSHDQLFSDGGAIRSPHPPIDPKSNPSPS
jgi:hypothetical protein